jgi:hypothetical protein
MKPKFRIVDVNKKSKKRLTLKRELSALLTETFRIKEGVVEPTPSKTEEVSQDHVSVSE